MKTLTSLVRWIAGILFFSATFCILSVCLFALKPGQTFAVARRLFAVLIRIMGVRLRVTGSEHIDPERAWLIMGNHQSLFDLFVIPAAIPLCFTGVEASYHFAIPVWGYLIRKWGCIPIERENLEKAKQSLEQARQTLASGLSIAILPEGHRTRTGRMGPFKKGPFHLARNARADILPFGISGLFDFNAKGVFHLSPGIVRVRIGTPISFESYRDLPVEDVRDLVYKRIQTLAE